jgi:hypothetical protein
MAIKAPTSPSSAAHLHMQTHYARRIMRTCFITTARNTPVLRRTPVHEMNHAKSHSLFDVSRIRLRSPFPLLRTGIYSLPLFFFYGAVSLKSQKVLNQIFPLVYGTRRFIAASAKAHNLSLY